MLTEKFRGGEAFFFYYSFIIFVIVAGGFGANALVNTDLLPPSSPILYVHGIIMIVWYGLVVIQTGLIRSGNYSVHMALGKASFILATGIVISGTLISMYSFHRPSGFEIVTINLFILVSFIVLYTLALINRNYADRHKRLMVFASIALILPALGRITQALGISDFASFPVWLILMIVVVAYDIVVLRKIHWATILGFLLITAGAVISIVLIDSPGWKQMVNSAFE